MTSFYGMFAFLLALSVFYGHVVEGFPLAWWDAYCAAALSVNLGVFLSDLKRGDA